MLLGSRAKLANFGYARVTPRSAQDDSYGDFYSNKQNYLH